MEGYAGRAPGAWLQGRSLQGHIHSAKMLQSFQVVKRMGEVFAPPPKLASPKRFKEPYGPPDVRGADKRSPLFS